MVRGGDFETGRCLATEEKRIPDVSARTTIYTWCSPLPPFRYFLSAYRLSFYSLLHRLQVLNISSDQPSLQFHPHRQLFSLICRVAPVQGHLSLLLSTLTHFNLPFLLSGFGIIISVFPSPFLSSLSLILADHTILPSLYRIRLLLFYCENIKYFNAIGHIPSTVSRVDCNASA